MNFFRIDCSELLKKSHNFIKSFLWCHHFGTLFIINITYMYKWALVEGGKMELHVTSSQRNIVIYFRFVGICIAKNHWQNTLGATFTLRNVIDGEPLEINFQLYSPLIQRIEVLKHQRRHRSALWYLRDYPPALSAVSEKMRPAPYQEKPTLYIPSKEEKERIKKWFAQVRKEKRRKWLCEQQIAKGLYTTCKLTLY